MFSKPVKDSKEKSGFQGNFITKADLQAAAKYYREAAVRQEAALYVAFPTS